MATKTIKNLERHVEYVDGAVKLTYKENALEQTITNGEIYVSGNKTGSFSVNDQVSYGSTGTEVKEMVLSCSISGTLSSGQLSSVMNAVHSAKTGIDLLPS